MTDAPEFNWASDDSVAVQTQPAIAVYPNDCGQVTLRRERAWNEEDDCFIHIAKQNVLTIIAHILRAAEMYDIELIRARGGGGYEDVELQDLITGGAVLEPSEGLTSRPKRKDKTAAERQRRRRAKTRDSRDGDRDSVTVTPDTPSLIAAE